MAKQKVGLVLGNAVGCLNCHRTESVIPKDFNLKSDGSGFTLNFEMPKGWTLYENSGVHTVMCASCAAGKPVLAELPEAAPQAKTIKSKKVASL